VSAAAQTKIFGLRIGVDPKILVGGMIVVAALLFWYNSKSDDEQSAPAARPNVTAPAATTPVRAHTPIRRAAPSGDRAGTLRLRAIDATQGDIDPTLRLDLLMRLQFIKPEEGGRNLFELGPAPLTPQQVAMLKNAPRLPPKPLPPPMPINTGPAPLNIPLKYYGFVKGGAPSEPNRGLFLDGDNVLVGSEGEVLKQHYLVVELRDNSARLEDVQRKEGQTLPVVPVAVQQ
jgi:hypothetical protein